MRYPRTPMDKDLVFTVSGRWCGEWKVSQEAQSQITELEVVQELKEHVELVANHGQVKEMLKKLERKMSLPKDKE